MQQLQDKLLTAFAPCLGLGMLLFQFLSKYAIISDLIKNIIVIKDKTFTRNLWAYSWFYSNLI